MPKYIYNGEEYSVQDLVQAAEASNLTVEDYILNAGIEVIEDESFQTGPVKETAVAGPMTEAQQQAVDTVSVLEDTSLESPEVDFNIPDNEITVELYEQMPVARKKQIDYSNRQRLIRERNKKSKPWEEEFASELTSTNFEDLNINQIIKLQDEAQKEIESEYSINEDYEITPNEISLKAIDIFNKKIKPRVPAEQEGFFEEQFGENIVTDFLDDITLAAKTGYNQAEMVDPSFELLKRGGDVSDEDILNFIETQKSTAAANMQSDEMRDFNRIYEENDGGVLGFIKGVAKNPSILPSLLVSSLATQAGSIIKSDEVAYAATAGAVAGTPVPILGTIGGTIAGAASAMESALTFSELLQEEAGEDLSVENIRAVLDDEEKYNSLVRKSLGRGLTIGFIEGITGPIAAKVGSNLAKKGVGEIVRTTTVGGIEATGGGTGEVLGRAVAGQPMDVAEIGFEAVTGTATAPVTVGSQLIDLNNTISDYKVRKEVKNLNQENIAKAFDKEFGTTTAQVKLSQLPNSEKILNEEVDRQVRANEITKEKGEEIKLNFRETQGTVNRLKPLDIVDVNLDSAVELVKEKTELEQKIKQVDEAALTEAESQRVKEIDTELKRLMGDVGRTVAVAKSAKALGIKTQLLTPEQFAEKAKKDNIASIKQRGDLSRAEKSKKLEEAETLDYSNKFGGYALDGTLYINADKIQEINQLNVGAHEVLHPILNALVGNAETQGRLVEDFKNQLTEEEQALMDKELSDRGYTDQNEINTEYLNVFSDLLQKETIKLKPESRTKLGALLNRLFKALGGKKLSIKDGKGVYEFMREYSKAAREGALSDKIINFVQQEAKAKGITTFQPSKADLKSEIDIFVQEDGAKKYDTKAEFQMSDDFANAYTKITDSNLLDGSVLSIINRDDNLSGLSDDVKAEIIEKTKENVSMRFLQNFDPAKNESLFGWMLGKNGALGFAVLDVKKDYAKTARETSLDVPAGERGFVGDIAVEPTTEEAIDEAIKVTRAEAKLIDPVDIITDKATRDKYRETVQSKIENLTDKQLSFKNLKDLAPEITAEVFGVPVKKVVDPTANLSKGDATNAQMFITKNADKLIKLLPEGAVLEAATEKLIGTSTGVPKKLLEAFYDKQERITKKAGLFPYKKKPNITKEDFLAAFGIVEGKKAPDFSPRSAEAQATKGLMSLFGRLMTNTTVRKELAKTPGTETVRQDIAAGKAPIQFSTSAQRNEAYRGAKTISEYGIDSKQFKDLKVSKEIKQLLKKLANKKVITGNTFNGIVYEEITSNDIKRYGKELGLDLKVLDNKSAGYDSTKPDIQIKVKRDIGDNVIVNLEVKKDKYARFGSVTFRFNFENLDKPKIEIVQNRKVVKPGEIQNEEVFMSILNEATPYVKDILNTINEIEGTSYNSFPLGSKIKATTFEKLKQTSAFANLKSIQKGLNSSVIAQHYNKKGNYYIQIGKSGLYYLGEDVYNIGVPRLDVVFSGSINLKRSGIKDGMTTISLRSEPKIKKAGQLKKSNIDLNTKEGVKEFDEKVKTSTFQASKTAKATKEKILDTQFNNILENKTGIAAGKEYSKAKAEVVGANKGRFNWFIPPTAEDFVGLLYQFLGKGKLGDRQMAWFKVNLLDPYARAMSKVSRDRVSTARNYRALKKELDIVPKDLKKKVPGEDFTVEQAVRVYIWNKQGYEVPGLSKQDGKELREYVNSKPELKEFGDKLILLNKGFDYAKPKAGWLAGTITTDMLETLNTTKRAEYLKEWQNNVDVIFSEKNLNKIEAAYGPKFRYALENVLTRMKTGRNRTYGTDSLTGRVVDWLTNSIGAIMFFNTRSAILQTISAVNFINFSDNNPLAATKALSNQKQYWSDFLKLFNSDFLVDRRDGLRLNVNESDIADMAKKNGARGVISEILKAGFLPTQLADSFAIASGGATFYRNRLNRYLKEGIDPKKAEEMAFTEFREIAEESQQSSRPDRISAQQAGPLGRIILAFANTPAQYARLMKKAVSDLKNNRGDAKTNISKLIYYGIAQNLIFNAMQQALFGLMFGDEEEEDEKKEKKVINIANSMADSILRGMGISGAIVSVLKNTVKKLIERTDKRQPDYAENAIAELLKISPPVGSKVSKVKNALRSYEWDKDKMYEKGLALDNPAYLAAGNIISAATNIPLDRAVKKVTNVKNAMDEDLQLWQRIALLGGWQDWEIGAKEEERERQNRNKAKFKTTTFKTTKFK